MAETPPDSLALLKSRCSFGPAIVLHFQLRASRFSFSGIPLNMDSPSDVEGVLFSSLRSKEFASIFFSPLLKLNRAPSHLSVESPTATHIRFRLRRDPLACYFVPQLGQQTLDLGLT